MGLMAVAFFTLAGCTHTGHIALMSNGALEGRRLTGIPPGPTVEGHACGFHQNLSAAFNNALANTPYDTVINAEITHTTGIFVWSNCVSLKGQGVRSTDLPKGGD